MLERRDVITNDVLEPITFILAYPTVLVIREALGSHPDWHTGRGLS